MSIKKAMQVYFVKRKEIADSGFDFLFKTSIDSENAAVIYDGCADDEGYVAWKPVEIDVVQDFVDLERDFGMRFHSSVIEYFNSYWFADLDGFCGEYYISLDAVLPYVGQTSFRDSLFGYRRNHDNRLVKLPIGIEGNGLLVVVDNKSGVIQLEDFETGSFEQIANDLQGLIARLEIRKKSVTTNE